MRDYNFDFIVREMGGGILTGRDRTRMRVRIRDAFKCRECGKVRTIREVKAHNSKLPSAKGSIKLFDVHHIDGNCGKFSRGYDNIRTIDGMITLCHQCHFRHHLFSLRNVGVWQPFVSIQKDLRSWGLTKEELLIKAPKGI